jgi:hypothetical protein
MARFTTDKYRNFQSRDYTYKLFARANNLFRIINFNYKLFREAIKNLIAVAISSFLMAKKFVCMKFAFVSSSGFCVFISVFIASYSSFEYFVSFSISFIKTRNTLMIGIVSI